MVVEAIACEGHDCGFDSDCGCEKHRRRLRGRTARWTRWALWRKISALREIAGAVTNPDGLFALDVLKEPVVRSSLMSRLC
jgi:hypothetical protein